MGKRRRTEIVEIANPAARLVTYSKRRKGLFNKASELCRLCDARVAVVVFSPAGKPCSFGDPSADEIIADYLGDCNGDVMPPISLTDLAEWVETEWEACVTEEELESLIRKFEVVRDYAWEKLMGLEADSRAKVVDGGDSHLLSDGEIDSIFESFKDRCPALLAKLSDVEACLPSLENLAAGGGYSTVEPTPALSDLGDDGFNLDDFLNLNGDGSGFVTSPEDSAGGNSGGFR